MKPNPAQLCALLAVLPQTLTPSTDGLPYAQQAREALIWVVFSILFYSYLAGSCCRHFAYPQSPQGWER